MQNQTSTVYVAGDDMGNIITVSQNNPDYGWITLKQEALDLTNGWANKKTRSAIIMGLVNVLEDFNLTHGEVLPGKIVVREQTEPFSTPDRDVKRAGADGPVLTDADGNTIYRKTFFIDQATIDADPSRGVDTMIPHANAEEVREYNASQRNLTKVSADQTAELADSFDL